MFRGKLLLVLIAALAAGTMYLGVTTYSPPRIAPEESERPTEAPHPMSPPAHRPHSQTSGGHVETIYLAYNTGTDILLTPVNIEAARPSPRHALLSLLRYRPAEDSGLVSPIPAGVRLLDLDISPDGTATANFSRELQTNFGGGSRSEQVMLFAIVNTLCRFPQVKRVRLLIDGQVVESIGGHMAANELLEPDYSIVAQVRGQQ